MISHVHKWIEGEPRQLIAGLAVQYECGKVELVGSQKHVLTGPVRRHVQLVEAHELEWLQSMANKRGL